jgi:hypothetical protein
LVFTVYFLGLQYDPCSGEPEAPVVISEVQPLQFGLGLVAGQAIFRAGPADFPNTRNQQFQQSNFNNTITKNGLLAGQTTVPVWLFIPPELLTFGEKMFPIGMYLLFPT